MIAYMQVQGFEHALLLSESSASPSAYDYKHQLFKTNHVLSPISLVSNTNICETLRLSPKLISISTSITHLQRFTVYNCLIFH